MAREFIDELSNGGYIRILQTLATESGARNVSFAREYADSYGVSIGAALLFGPKGGAYIELLHLLAAEKVHGLHRNGTSPNPRWTEDTKNRWYDAQRTGNWPRMMDENGNEVSMDVAEEQGRLPEGFVETLREMWRRNPVLQDYTGTNRLSGDIPYQIIEDVVDMILQKRFSPLDEIQKARYTRIIEDANKQDIDPFYAVYRNLFVNKDRLRLYWNKARKWLYDYSISLWEAKNEIWLAEGKRVPSSGAVFRPKKNTPPKPKRNKIPGTISRSKGRYYWVVTGKMQCIPKIDNVWPTWTEEKVRLALMDEHPRMPVIGKLAMTKPLTPMIERMQRVDWLVENCIVVLDDNCPVASKEVTIQSRGEKWYVEIKKQGKRAIIKGSTSIDKDTRRIRITIYGQGFSESRVLTEEVYHIVFEIIRHASPRTFESIKKWYANRLRKGLDPTWHMYEAFVDLMLQEEEFPGSTDLPRHAVKYARRVFSTTNTVPDSVIERIKAGV